MQLCSYSKGIMPQIKKPFKKSPNRPKKTKTVSKASSPKDNDGRTEKRGRRTKLNAYQIAELLVEWKIANTSLTHEVNLKGFCQRWNVTTATFYNYQDYINKESDSFDPTVYKIYQGLLNDKILEQEKWLSTMYNLFSSNCKAMMHVNEQIEQMDKRELIQFQGGLSSLGQTTVALAEIFATLDDTQQQTKLVMGTENHHGDKKFLSFSSQPKTSLPSSSAIKTIEEMDDDELDQLLTVTDEDIERLETIEADCE